MSSSFLGEKWLFLTSLLWEGLKGELGSLQREGKPNVILYLLDFGTRSANTVVTLLYKARGVFGKRWPRVIHYSYLIC